jgi:hypothetical protein
MTFPSRRAESQPPAPNPSGDKLGRERSPAEDEPPALLIVAEADLRRRGSARQNVLRTLRRGRGPALAGRGYTRKR